MPTLVDKFDYELPKELIALYPADKRDKCRLMMVDTAGKSITHHIFSDIYDLLNEETFLVINNTKVRNARIYAHKVTGGKSEIFVTNVIDANHFQGLVRGSFKKGDTLLADNYIFTLIEKDNEGIWFIKSSCDIEKIMENIGHIPLPPYIERQDNLQDKADYQTVYAKYTTSSAAPTAGLHFTSELLEKLKVKGVNIVEITLDVGLGTFRPVKCDNILDHHMDSEVFEIPEETARMINLAKAEGKKIVAVGTTTVRTLETAAILYGKELKACKAASELFIYPPYEFKIVDSLITNFHLPKSTLLMLVSALAGKDFIFKAYEEAITNKYRFYSYGDCMFID